MYAVKTTLVTVSAQWNAQILLVLLDMVRV